LDERHYFRNLAIVGSIRQNRWKVSDQEVRPLLHCQRLTVNYASATTPALCEIDFEIGPGEVVGVLGESGCGKSTLALSILGLLPPGALVEGSIRFHDQDLLHLNEPQLRTVRGAQISLIHQEPGLSLSPVLRMGEQISEVLGAHRPMTRSQRKQECKAMLSEVQLGDVDRIYNSYPHQLSGGELHRVAIAQALICRPQLVICDEPTSSLDVTIQAEILSLLRGLKQKLGMAMIFITHNPALLAGFADRVLVIHAGKIVEEGRVAQVFRRPLHSYTNELLQLVTPEDGRGFPS
jgi:ABC-type glutathione transport system ATPase component